MTIAGDSQTAESSARLHGLTAGGIMPAWHGGCLVKTRRVPVRFKIAYIQCITRIIHYLAIGQYRNIPLISLCSFCKNLVDRRQQFLRTKWFRQRQVRSQLLGHGKV
jgi:hypothetical protein